MWAYYYCYLWLCGKHNHLVWFLGPQTELEVIVLGECELRKVRAQLCLDRMPIFLEGKEERGLKYAIWPTPRNHRICTADFWCVDKKKEKSKYVVHMHINKCYSFNNRFAQLTYCWNFVWWVGSLKNRLTINLIEANWGVCLVGIQISI